MSGLDRVHFGAADFVACWASLVSSSIRPGVAGPPGGGDQFRVGAGWVEFGEHRGDLGRSGLVARPDLRLVDTSPPPR